LEKARATADLLYSVSHSRKTRQIVWSINALSPRIFCVWGRQLWKLYLAFLLQGIFRSAFCDARTLVKAVLVLFSSSRNWPT